MFPVHSRSRAHWTLLVVNLKDHKFICVESLGIPCLRDPDLLAFIAKVMGTIVYLAKRCLFTRVNWASWKVHLCMDIPMQPNGYDCGAIICVYMGAICQLSSASYEERYSTQVSEVWLNIKLAFEEDIRLFLAQRGKNELYI